MPARSTAEMCTNTSFPPLSGWMKPKPLVSLNHLTVPTGILVLRPRGLRVRRSARRCTTASMIEPGAQRSAHDFIAKSRRGRYAAGLISDLYALSGDFANRSPIIPRGQIFPMRYSPGFVLVHRRVRRARLHGRPSPRHASSIPASPRAGLATRCGPADKRRRAAVPPRVRPAYPSKFVVSAPSPAAGFASFSVLRRENGANILPKPPSP